MMSARGIPEKIDLNLNYYKIEIFFVDIEEMVESFVERPALGQVGPWQQLTKNETLNPHGIDSSERQQDEQPRRVIYIAISASNQAPRK